MNDDALIEKMAKAIAKAASHDPWQDCIPEAHAALVVARKAILEEAAQIATNDSATWNHTGHGRSVSSRIAERIHYIIKE